MAGMAGLEPASEGVKVPCLTAWLHPYIMDQGMPETRFRAGTEAPALSLIAYGVGKGIRTLDTRNHNPVL